MQQHYQVGHYQKYIMTNRAPKTVLQRDQETVIRSAFTLMCHYYKDAIDKVRDGTCHEVQGCCWSQL